MTGVDTDVAIIGAGPAGTAAAIRLGQLGITNVVLVDRHDFPRDKTCGSAVSPKGLDVLKALGVWDQISAESYPIRGLRLVTRAEREAYLSGPEDTAAIICCRRILDHILLKRALSLGTRFVPNFDAQELIYEGGRVGGIKARDGRAVHAKYTFVANGAHSEFVVNKKPKRIIQAIMGWWEGVPFTQNHVEMIFDKMVSPHYGWLFPESSTRVNIGICYEDPAHTRNARTLFQQFLEKHYRERLAGAVAVGDWKGHPISYSYTIAQLYSPGRIVIGEAGRMTHPATAEGIYQGMRSGMIAAEAVRDVISQVSSEQEAGTTYQSRCGRAFQPSFRSAKLWRGAVASPALDWVVAFAQRPLVKKTLNRLMSEM